MLETAIISPEMVNYDQIAEDLRAIDPDLELSHLHGLLTGLIVAGASEHAQYYLRSLVTNKTGPNYHQTTQTLFSIYTITHTWLQSFGFDFRMLLPDDQTSLSERLLAFSDWCLGFLSALELSEFSLEDFENEEDIEILQHFEDFSELDATDPKFNQEDEKAYLEITEYARLAVLQLYCDLHTKEQNDSWHH